MNPQTRPDGITGPVDPRKRIESVDMVRGFALFGVLLVNMYNFGAYSRVWTGGLDQTAFSIMRVFFETKSWRLFSFLFGLGFSFQLLSAQKRGQRLFPTYLRRLAILFLIGMAHALFYDGDILMLYAELGLFLLAFSRVSPALLLAMAMGLLTVFPVGRVVKSQGESPVVQAVEAVDSAQARAAHEKMLAGHPYVVGSVVDVMAVNAEAIPANPFAEPLGPESGLAFFAMFLLGLYVGKRRIFQEVDVHLELVRSVFRWGLVAGFLGMAVERVLAVGFGYTVFRGDPGNPLLTMAGDLAFAFGSTALCLGYAAAIVLAARNARFRWAVEPLAPVGRLALTVYLTQTLAFSTLFYGYGLGQFGRIGPAAVTGWAILIFALQVLACRWWVRRYRFGPAEWLWRSLTYLKAPQMRL